MLCCTFCGLGVEGAGAAQWVPDGPGPIRIQGRSLGTFDEPVLDVGFVTAGVAPPQHGELGPQREGGEGPTVQERAHQGDEVGRVLGHGQEPDSSRMIQVQVEHGRLQPAGLELLDQRLGVAAAAEDVKLHEEPPVGRMLVPVPVPAMFQDVDPVLRFLGVHARHTTRLAGARRSRFRSRDP